MTATSAPPVAPSDPSRVPLPPVSENATLQTEPRPSNASSRPPSVQNVPQFAFSNTPAPHSGMPYNMPFMSPSHISTSPPPLPTNNSNSVATKIDMDRIMRQDEAAMNDFVPPRQAMNSDESDFDWDEDINIVESGQVHKKQGKDNGSPWRKLSPFLRMVILVLVGSPIVALPAILVSALRDDDQEGEYPTKATVMLIFVWLSFMWGIIFVTNWGIDMVPVIVVRLTGFVTGSRSEDLKSRLLMFVACKKYLKWLIASCWAIGSFTFLSKSPFNTTNDQMVIIFIEVLGCLVAGSALVFIEKILLHLISTNFHQTAYADRIAENKYALTVLDRLSTSKKVNIKQAKGARPGHSRHNTADNVNLQYNLHNMNNNTATEYAFPTGYLSAQPSRSNSIEVHGNNNGAVKNSNNGSPGRIGGSLDGREILHEIHGDDTTPPKTTEAMILNSTPLTTPTDMIKTNSRQSTLVPSIRNQHRGQRDSKIKTGDNNIFKGINRRLHGIALANKSSPSKDIGSTANAKRLAKTLFYNLQTNGEDLVVENFYPYFSTQDEARAAFTIFDKDGNGDISKSEMKEKIFYVYKERKDLHTSLRDLSQAVGKLNAIFLTIVAIIWLLIILSIFGKDIVKNMLSIGSFLVALSFVFGNSVKTLFENIVFLFITHPYDSGDLVSIEGSDMYVREVGLNSTTFVTWDGKRMYYPNNLISQKPIHNVRRSPNMTDKIVLNIDCYTPQSKIFELRARMRDYLIRESKDFLPDLEIQIQEMDAKLKISMCIEHKGNWQDSGRRWARRTAFNYALKEAVEEIGIQYYALPQRVEVYDRGDVAMRDLSLDPLQGGSSPGGLGRERVGGETAATLGPNSPLRQYPPEHVARLYRRTTIKKPQGEGEGGGE
ncbi:hypothetical protein EC957_006936 [Mortierella hygrophila]|uniref:EF-hand domain-containing protein n=1 Tax=Mortierella hygrophila TaxID=979708 RepID=A0A9P6EZ68_9FUNG|nr:hypothetical protein EC957_006936 [Mortierella hygrophila]